ncbi:MAG: class I tRNA ligase family protein, partial [Candidatus Nanopelagicales bacterium]
PVDKALLAGLHQVVEDATRAFEGYNYTRALEVTETFFWSFCDDYIELIKERAHGARGPEAAASAKATLALALSVQLRLFAPFLPFVTEEVWSWWQAGLVHTSAWPTTDELAAAHDGDATVLTDAGIVLSKIRKAKSEAKVSMRTPVESTVVTGPGSATERIQLAAGDLRAAGSVAELTITATDSDAIDVAVVLAVVE